MNVYEEDARGRQAMELLENSLFREAIDTIRQSLVDQTAALRGRTPVGSITAFKNDVKVGLAGENPWSFIEANGLKVVQEPV